MLHWLAVIANITDKVWLATLYRRHNLLPRGPDGDFEILQTLLEVCCV